jgi:Tfp pilus assembly protein PilN
MPGVNLSQSMNEEEQNEEHSFFDVGIILSLVALLVVGLGWGGLRLYIGSLNKKIAAIDESLSASKAQLKGEHIDKVADFDARLKYFSANMAEFTDPQSVFQKVEGSMVSGVVLTRFDYDTENEAVTFEGACADFKQLAEQVMSLKAEKTFLQVTVDQIDRNDDNQVMFVIKASLK